MNGTEQNQDQLILQYFARSLRRFTTAREGSEREWEATESIAEKLLNRTPTKEEVDTLLTAIR